jgi:hypothetical protein
VDSVQGHEWTVWCAQDVGGFLRGEGDDGEYAGPGVCDGVYNDLAMDFVAGRSVAFSGLVVKGGVGVYHE